MDMTEYFLIGVSLPFLGTTLGAALVFFLKGPLNSTLQRFLLGFASGVMIAASIWSLLLPAIAMTERRGGIVWLPPLAGFLAGVVFLMALDHVIPCLCTEAHPCGQSAMLVLAITLHNIPEGMAVGVALAGALSGELIPMAGALALAFGIAVQNIPEGAVISLPLAASGLGRGRAFYRGFLSGVVEPVFTVITILLISLVTPILPYILSFAAGAMIYVVVEELIPEAQSGPPSRAATIGAALGFAVMMTLDVALG